MDESRHPYRVAEHDSAILGPACAIGSRATLPVHFQARQVILANDCADYLECVGWKHGADRRTYLRYSAIDYCAAAEWCGGLEMRGATHTTETVAEVESYMRRHVAAYVRRLREINAARRAAERASLSRMISAAKESR